MNERFELILLRSGAQSIHSLDYGETMHIGLGPAEEAETLYVKGLRIVERLRETEPGAAFVVWDVGLGAAANALAVIRAGAVCEGTLRLVSFDHCTDLLRFAIQHTGELGYLDGFAERLETLIEEGTVSFNAGPLRVEWELIRGDFPTWLRSPEAQQTVKPHAILFDPFSPARNPGMWTASVFDDLFAVLDPARPCSLATYSRSTMTRAGLLLAGFHAGVGHATGLKEETTVAANESGLITRPLDERWLERARKSTGAEPLREAVYRQAPLTPETWSRLQRHPQFQKA
jgi:tRNA U34 5-methylaminomethyl-2-thiouridine-forming methyltransferase MnmC